MEQSLFAQSSFTRMIKMTCKKKEKKPSKYLQLLFLQMQICTFQEKKKKTSCQEKDIRSFILFWPMSTCLHLNVSTPFWCRDVDNRCAMLTPHLPMHFGCGRERSSPQFNTSLYLPQPWKHLVNLRFSLYFGARSKTRLRSGCLLRICWM